MQLGDFRVREFEIPLRVLPPDLDGLTSAHVSDPHVGRFTYGQKLKNIAEVTNSLRADLVLLTGDLIDYALADLPAALDMVRRMDPRAGLYLCQGNHDLFQSRDRFDAGVRAAGFPLLVNSAARVQVRGRPVQLLGVRWAGYDDHLPEETGKDAGVYTYVPQLAALRDPDAFPILLAHHPHAFDPAAAAGFPLTLAGHTHGGQLMLTDHLGPGPLFYRYWSGLYRKPNGASLVVSNGVGNWFPLRTHAPAEIPKLTLRAITPPGDSPRRSYGYSVPPAPSSPAGSPPATSAA
jgi:predicted MPP superfamily phosphohydrolase